MSDEVTNPLGIHFEHEWQREAWDAEIRAMREGTKRGRASEANDKSIDIAGLIGELKPTIVPDVPLECGAPPYSRAAAHECCDRVMHYEPSEHGLVAVRRCPALARREVQDLIGRERKRLAGEIALIEESAPFGFEGYDPILSPVGKVALAAAREFAEGRPPKRRLFFAGTTGLGKTRLMLASHFALLAAGVKSIYVTSPELRDAFEDQRNFDEELKIEGRNRAERIVRAQVVHLDDLGNVENDDRKRGQFAEGLKRLLDRTAAPIFAATNLTWNEAMKHPDVGEKVLSRLVSGAVVVKLEGEDYRVAQSERAR